VARKQTFIVYKCTSPSGRAYVGYTAQPLSKRWRQHVRRSETKTKHPFYSAIRKYGPENFCVEIVAEYPDRISALVGEVTHIAEQDRPYNVSLGGEDDSAAGVDALRDLRLDPEWDVAFRAKLSEAVSASEAHRSRWPLITEMAKEWRDNNPEKAYRTSRRALRIAAKSTAPRKKHEFTDEQREKMSRAQKERWANAPASVKKRKSMTSRKATAEVWASRSLLEKETVAAKISTTLKKRNRDKTEQQLQQSSTQLAEARKHINHDKRKQRQKEGIAAYWTPERRAEKAIKMREVRRLQLERKHENI